MVASVYRVFSKKDKIICCEDGVILSCSALCLCNDLLKQASIDHISRRMTSYWMNCFSAGFINPTMKRTSSGVHSFLKTRSRDQHSKKQDSFFWCSHWARMMLCNRAFKV